MTWCKLDDQLHGHPKVKGAWYRSRASLGLHLMALSYCACYLTDGYVPDEFVQEKLPARSERSKAVEALVDWELWRSAEGGWRICDYLDYNPSRQEVEDARADKSAAGRKGANARWGKAHA